MVAMKIIPMPASPHFRPQAKNAASGLRHNDLVVGLFLKLYRRSGATTPEMAYCVSSVTMFEARDSEQQVKLSLF
jgi:hypothetical protein